MITVRVDNRCPNRVKVNVTVAEDGNVTITITST